MSHVLVIVLIGVRVLSGAAASVDESYCYSLDENRTQWEHFATRTAYEVVRGSSSSRDYFVADCIPTKYWLLARHGTRLHGAKYINFLPQSLNKLRDAILANNASRRMMCPDDLDLLRNWRWDSNMTTDYEGFLTESGWNELKNLATREKTRFGALFNGPYREDRFHFRYTNTQRTVASFWAFADGLFGDGAYVRVHAEGEPTRDTLLRPHFFCPDYDENKRKIRGPGSEQDKFMQSALFRRTVADISTRLGFPYNLTLDQIEDMWDHCRFEQAWYLPQLSPWCSVFTKEQVNVLEYKEDLRYYYQSGHGYARAADLACFTMADMMRHLGQAAGNPSVIAYFCHESIIQLFLVALGAKKDPNPLRSDNYEAMRKRQFRTSEWTPFAANVAVVRYQCNDVVSPVKIKFFLNEKGLMFDWCERVEVVLKEGRKFL
ncbi:hypothetical protein pipiens_006141 [Culex pipiens pipiens]|uniref:Multiple inositol polyphosphate phosphatase 1 n=1 Tax=Culex pipiens pipiens TaxID=38569 RepID=A0ABD1DRF2_CULPP